MLTTCTLPRNKIYSNTHQTEHVHLAPQPLFYQETFGRHWKKGGSEKSGSNIFFYTMQRINPLGSTVSITSMIYCIYYAD
ncbi:unnamed protein product [Staurois parvus]|uniref:Uncharacterized protein n=1 Tax=Staurois parvus TaxID=386267 RepID=A0ABN9CF90_9NEOB|nr:unnamed protein product [Staurois parvus]